jgi:hypothetical protein
MIKLISRATLLTLITCCSALISRAQLGYDYSQYELGAGIGLNSVSGAAQTQTLTPTVNLNFTYNTSPYVNFVFEMQLGRIAGGDSLTTSTGRQFTADIDAFVFRGQFQLGEILDYGQSPFKNALKNFYISAGVGYVVSHITSINRYSIKTPGEYTGGDLNTQEPMIPFRIGYEFKIFNKYRQPACKIDFGYNYNKVLSGNIDGFETGQSEAYTQFSIGVKFAIGGAIISYRKPIPYN